MNLKIMHNMQLKDHANFYLVMAGPFAYYGNSKTGKRERRRINVIIVIQFL
jgi:hypothetical protein